MCCFVCVSSSWFSVSSSLGLVFVLMFKLRFKFRVLENIKHLHRRDFFIFFALGSFHLHQTFPKDSHNPPKLPSFPLTDRHVKRSRLGVVAPAEKGSHGAAARSCRPLLVPQTFLRLHEFTSVSEGAGANRDHNEAQRDDQRVGSGSEARPGLWLQGPT